MKISEIFSDSYMSESVQDMLEFFALTETESGEVDDLEEASKQKAAAIGFALGGFTGAAIGAASARGKQRDLQVQLDRGKKKLQKWRSDPEKNKDKIQRLQGKMSKWNAELQHLKDTGTGDAGKFRKSHAQKEEQKRKKQEKESEKNNKLKD